MSPNVSLDQWRVFQAVVDHGGYARAADVLHRSQSSVSYAIKSLQERLGVRVLEIRGRRAELTGAGRVVLRRCRLLVQEAQALERAAATLGAGWEAEVRVAVEVVFPTDLLLRCLAQFATHCPDTRVELTESVLSGTGEALMEGAVDLAVSSHVPPGFLGDPLMHMEFVAVAAPGHALHAMGRTLSYPDLARERQVVVRDSGLRERRDAGWLEAERRWTVTTMDTAIEAVCHGLGFAWMPRDRIREALAAGRLVPLALREGGTRRSEFYLVFADRDYAGPATHYLAGVIREQVAAWATDGPAARLAGETNGGAHGP